MAYEERQVVAGEPVVQRDVVADPASAPAYVDNATVQPVTVVERRSPQTRIVQNDDPVGNAYAASQMIQTIVWAVVVLVLLVVALLALHVYAHLF
jgi:hypothetical protein